MVRVIGIDPGTRTWDFVGLDDGKTTLDLTVSTDKIKNEPLTAINILQSFDPCLVIAPSGYGLPIKQINELTSNDFFQITLKKEKEEDTAYLGVTGLLKLMIKYEIPGYIIPGVKHLSTVPAHRKINKIDMGTPDKVCSAALGIHELANQRKTNYEDISFILAEIGSCFNGFIAVENGKITDGIGGTLASMGFRSAGRLDAELACLLKFEKHEVFKGGFKSIPDTTLARNAFIEGVISDINSLSSIVESKTVLLSPSRSIPQEIVCEIKKRLKNLEIKTLKGFAGASSAAQGAALIANGLSGGIHSKLVDCMELKDAKGSVFDYLFFEDV